MIIVVDKKYYLCKPNTSIEFNFQIASCWKQIIYSRRKKQIQWTKQFNLLLSFLYSALKHALKHQAIIYLFLWLVLYLFLMNCKQASGCIEIEFEVSETSVSVRHHTTNLYVSCCPPYTCNRDIPEWERSSKKVVVCHCLSVSQVILLYTLVQ